MARPSVPVIGLVTAAACLALAVMTAKWESNPPPPPQPLVATTATIVEMKTTDAAPNAQNGGRNDEGQEDHTGGEPQVRGTPPLPAVWSGTKEDHHGGTAGSGGSGLSLLPDSSRSRPIAPFAPHIVRISAWSCRIEGACPEGSTNCGDYLEDGTTRPLSLSFPCPMPYCYMKPWVCDGSRQIVVTTDAGRVTIGERWPE